MKSSKPKTAESNFREAFERLKAGAPKACQLGTPVSQNNVAKEAGCDPSALRKSRFPGLVADIQTYLCSKDIEREPSKRQYLLKQRQQSRNARETIADLKAQRDAAASLLVEANAQICVLTRRNRDLEVRLGNTGSNTSNSRTLPSKPRATLRAMDMLIKK
ncbi:MAG: hypothetical protein K2W93_20870 [Burkholderiaceae bacterium]|nr:hypothetical protein [Burkholderiaceae bacterium]